MVPDFTEGGLLPPGVYWATWEETVSRFGGNRRRRELLAGLRAALENLRDAGCRTAYVNGSFVTAKDVPGDFDACWEEQGVARTRSTPCFSTSIEGVKHRRLSTSGSCFRWRMQEVAGCRCWSSSRRTRRAEDARELSP